MAMVQFQIVSAQHFILELTISIQFQLSILLSVESVANKTRKRKATKVAIF